MNGALTWTHLGPQPHQKMSGRSGPDLPAVIPQAGGGEEGGEKALMARVCAGQARPFPWVVSQRVGLSGRQQEVAEWLAQPGQGASFAWRNPASSVALWQVGQRGAPTTLFRPRVWCFLEQRTGHAGTGIPELKPKTWAREVLPTGFPAWPAAGKSLNQTHM